MRPDPRHRVLKWTATAYAIKAATQWMVRRRHEVEGGAKAGGADVPLDDRPGSPGAFKRPECFPP
jgi:hypothetical protein